MNICRWREVMESPAPTGAGANFAGNLSASQPAGLRSDKSHVATEHVEQPRRLVETAAAQQGPAQEGRRHASARQDVVAVLPAGVIARSLRSTYRCQTGHTGTWAHLIIRWAGRRRWICHNNDVERSENSLDLRGSAVGLPLLKLLDRVRDLFLGHGPS
jgi:hypothetical protein